MMKFFYKISVLIFLIFISLVFFKQKNVFEESWLKDENVFNHKKEIILDLPKSDCHPYTCFTPKGFVDAYNDFEATRADLEWKNKYILNHYDVDLRISDIAKSRGYQKRPFALEENIVPFRGKSTRPELRDAYLELESEMKELGMKLYFASGYRSSTTQREIFRSKLGRLSYKKITEGFFDKEVDNVLKISALPAYSKHHSGYAVDFGCGNERLVFSFVETPCYAYLAENNFHNAKRFGFIPSYPSGAGLIGPDPEPWEFVWVGEENLFADYVDKEEYFLEKDNNQEKNKTT